MNVQRLAALAEQLDTQDPTTWLGKLSATRHKWTPKLMVW